MPEISLNAYENEIDQLIEQARYLEALAHIRHILGQYPHYVGAYYLLGKLMLEVDLPGLATDMFRRALSADPEHLMARIGLGLAHERANNLDASIWNLERALELDPSNADISDELRRMYGRRDGTEPDHISQTRAGLARLYIRGDRPGRAVVELRKLLDESPGRPDLMTALAEAYWRDEQLVQASELCQELLDKMPYNCKANLLLGSLWVNSGQDEGWTYLNRAQEIDLSNAMAVQLFGADSLLEPREVQLDRLVYDPDAIEVDQSSAWFKRLESASMTTGISEAPPEMTESDVRLIDITAGLESQIEIPDWLRELGAEEEEDEIGALGWMAGADFTEEESVAAPEEETAPQQAFVDEDVETSFEAAETSEEEMPDWLQELTTQEVSFDLDESESAPDWLMELVGEQPAAETETAAAATEEAEAVEEEPLEGGDADWLSVLAAESEGASELEIEEAPVLEEEETAVGEEADWLADITAFEETESEGAGEEEALPNWLDELQSTVTEEVDQGAAEVEAPDTEDLPDWLSALEPTAEQIDELDIETLDTLSEMERDEIPDWLAELQETGPAASPGAQAEIEASEEEVPDWLQDLDAETEATVEDADWLTELLAEESEPAETVVAPPPEEDAMVSGEAYEPPSVSEGTLPQLEEEEGLSGEAALAWLDSLTVSEPAPAPPLEVEEEAPVGPVEVASDLSAEAPSVVEPEVETTEMETETVDEAPPVGEVEAEAEILETDLTAPEAADEPAEALMAGDDALAWLESLAEGKEEELRAQAAVESEARVAEILGRKPETAEPTEVAAPPVSEEAPAEPEEVVVSEEVEAAAEEIEAAPSAEAAGEELLSGDDALAWLESLAAGKEEVLRAQAEVESQARVDEILGRKRAETEPEPEAVEENIETEVVEPVAPQEEPAEEAVLLEAEPPAEEAAPAAEIADEGVLLEEPPAQEGVSEEGDLLSGDDAVAWLQSLTAGKEEALRAQAEAESEARVAEILGRKRAAPAEEAPTTEPEVVPEAAAESVPEEILEEPSEVAETGAETTVVGAEPPEAVLTEDLPAADDAEAEEGEDALAWLEGLDPEKQANLEAQLDASVEESVTEEPNYFGWSAFGDRPQEVAETSAPWEEKPAEEVGEPVSEAETPPTPAESEPEPESAVTEAPEEPEAKTVVAEPELEKATEPVEEAAAAEPVAEAAAEPTDEEGIPEEPEAPRPEAEASETTGEDLDEMREYVKKKRSDHAARLNLARALWEAGEIQESMQHYGRLIKSSAKTDDVTSDLESYVASEAVQSSVMRTLGDAYMKFGELDKALETYNRAMDML